MTLIFFISSLNNNVDKLLDERKTIRLRNKFDNLFVPATNQNIFFYIFLLSHKFFYNFFFIKSWYSQRSQLGMLFSCWVLVLLFVLEVMLTSLNTYWSILITWPIWHFWLVYLFSNCLCSDHDNDKRKIPLSHDLFIYTTNTAHCLLSITNTIHFKHNCLNFRYKFENFIKCHYYKCHYLIIIQQKLLFC